MIRRLTYACRLCHALADTELRVILGTARVLHRRLDLGGLLAYADRLFFHVIEGDPAPVETLMEIVRKDVPHERIRVVCDEFATAREYERWFALPVASLDLIDAIEAMANGEESNCAEAGRVSRHLLDDQADTLF